MTETIPRRWTEIKCIGTGRDYPRETHDEGDRIITAALAEVGFTTTSYWDEVDFVYRIKSGVELPDWALHTAAKIAADRLGIAYNVVAEHEATR